MRQRKLERHPRTNIFYLRVRGKRYSLGRDERDAKRQAREILLQIESGRTILESDARPSTLLMRPDGRRDMNVLELAARHLEWVRENRAESTLRIRQVFMIHFTKFMGSMMVSEMSLKKVEDFCQHMQKHHSKGPNAARESLKHVKVLAHWAAEYDICDWPSHRWPKYKYEVPETQELADDEFPKLLAILPPDFKDQVLFLGMTGLRPQEFRKLTGANIEKMANGRLVVTIRHHKTSATARTHHPRSVPLSPLAEEIVRRHLAARSKTGLLFLNGDGTPYTKDSLRIRLHRWCRRANIEKIRPYALRHYFGAKQAEANTNLGTISQMMGHTKVETTMRYLRNADRSHLDAVDAVGERFQTFIDDAAAYAPGAAAASAQCAS